MTIHSQEEKKMKEKKVLNLGLVNGRHEIPNVEGYVFNTTIDPKRMQWQEYMDTITFNGIWNICFNHYKNGEAGYLVQNQEDGDLIRIAENVHINLYVTGMTVALIATLNACRSEGISVTLYHYDRETGNYFPQEVL